MKRMKKILAAMLAAVIAVTGLPMSQIHAEELKTEALPRAVTEAPVLELKFEDNLADTSASNTQVTAKKKVGETYEDVSGSMTYVDGRNSGKALSFDGSTYLDLGKAEALSPGKLTLSLWIKPNADIEGEQVITWNKWDWNQDGWYLSLNASTGAIVLCVGGNYQAMVTGDVKALFPAGKWTHLAVTYDSDTKKALIYRNGIQQNVTMGGNASGGVINPCPTVQKSIGWNGESYKLPSLNAALDEYRLYDTVLSAKSIIEIYEQGGGTWDDTADVSAAVRKDLDAINISASTIRDLKLPVKGEEGCTISWSANGSQYLADDGKLLKRPQQGEADAEVTMTASVSYAGETPLTKDFKVTVKAISEDEDPSLLLELGFNDDTLTDTSVYGRTVAAAGTAAYTDGEGNNGRAVKFDGNTYLNLGKDEALTPSKMTLSFWLKPNADISGEQIIAWSKGNFNADGWYLNMNANVPLGLSVGPGTGSDWAQPHFIQVNGAAKDFFPTTAWTHVVVTYDSDTKEACFYRNGIPQKTTIGTAVSGTASGVIGTNNNINVIGSNGEVHGHGGKLNAALDEYCLYDRVFDAEEVIALYDKSGKTFDKQAAAQMDLDALSIDTTESLITGIALPEKGDMGSDISWSANGSKYLSDAGEVLERPELGAADAKVTLTATASYLNGTPATKDFVVTVKAITEGENTSLLLDLGFDGQNLLDSSIYNRKVENVGKVSYVAGVDGKGKAASLDGSAYLNLGTSNKLTPEVLSLSFWLKPNADISGEQIIAWNKGNYAGDGWYLNMNGNKPLGLSAGPGSSQPYFIQVNGTAKDFFPTGEWTHVVVTYNSKTKKAMFYRNGIPQKTTVGYPVSDTASGVIGTNNEVKVIGCNGSVHGYGGKLNAALDAYQLYDTEFTLEEVIGAYEESSGRTFDKQEIAQKDIEALEVLEVAENGMTLAAEGESGSVITWESNDAAIDIDGTTCTVTAPGYGEEDKVVTLTAKAVFAGGTPATRTFQVTVKAKKADLSGLKKAMEDAAEFVEETYTPESFQILKDALAAAQSVIDNKASTQEQVDTAQRNLEAAIDDLAKRADKEELIAAIQSAQAEEEAMYTAASWSNLQTALAEAVKVNNDANAGQEEVDAAKAALRTALANLEENSNPDGKPNKTRLETAIAEAKAKKEDLYTPDSWNVMQAALTEAERVFADEDTTQAEVTRVRQALETAANNLQKRADRTALLAAIEAAESKSESEYTAESWSNLQTALTAAKKVNEDGNATPEQVNAAKESLEEAIAKLLEKALVLDLAFEDNLTDASANAFEVKGSKAVSYVEGVKGKAISLDGSVHLNLGKDGKLSPGKLSLSFWINPEQKMEGEQAITWNKTQWYSDGWYLVSESDTTPLALSVGPAASEKQPYMVSVSGDRSKFFPAGEWTHILVTYDSETKEAMIYRNGIPQKTMVKYPLSATSTGVIGPCEDVEKSIGYNGPSYKGSYLKASLDEYRLYDKVLNQEQAIEVYEKSGLSFDKRAVAQSDIDALKIPDIVTGRLILAGKGESGSVITWKTSDSNVIALDGTVTRPEIGQPDKTVTLTAKAVFAGGEAVEKPFTVTVKAKTEKNQDGILDCGIDNVTLADSYLVNAAQKENDYLLSMTSKKFLYEFYRVSGLTPPTEEGYQGWERSNGTNFRGHTFGHYMSALSQAYKGTKDVDEKAALLVQIQDAVEGLRECQDAYAEKKPESAGYVSAFRESILDKTDGSGDSDENVIVPWYNLHKVLAGLIDIYTFVDDGELAEEALGIAENFGEYVFNRCSKLTDNQVMLRTEYGGMNEALYELYDITGNTHFKAAAEYFDEVALFDLLAANQDVLNGKHANTTIPKLIGALKRYTVMKDNEDYYDALTEAEQAELEKYKTAAVNFWDIVVEHHTYITGGNSQSEHFHEADKLYYDATKSDYDGSSTCETCNTYNMLKLSRELYKLTKDKKYMDYYENTYINAILSSQNPETGTTMYFQPMAPGYNKVFNRPHDEFWCCTGTGMENFSKLGDTIYFTEQSDVYVNMYFSNTFAFEKQNLKLTQEANIPNKDEITVTVAAIDGAEVAAGTNLKFRIPDWVAGEAAILVNGEKLADAADGESGYVTVADVKAGDVIKLTFPMEVRAYATQDNKDFVAFRYGPVALSAALGTNSIEASNPNGILVRVGTKDSTCQTVITVQDMSVEEWMDNVKENLVRIEDSEDGKVQFKLQNTDSPDLTYTPHFMRYKERYGLYMTFEEPGSEAGQKRIRDRKERLREEEMALDSLTNFDENNSEFAKNLKYEKSTMGSFNGRLYRDAQKDGWFSYDMQINPQAEKNYLLCTWYSGDKGRSFELYINGEKLQDVAITEEAGTNVFYTDRIEIPAKYWSEPEYKKDSTGEFVLDADGNKIPIINVKFQGNGASYVGGLYGIMTADTLEYSHNPNLSALSFDKGKLSPELNEETKDYTLKVNSITQSVSMKISPNTPSGLIFIDDILVDDAVARRIALTGATTTVSFKASAQDHETMAEYTVTIVKSTVDVSELASQIEQAESIEKGNYTDASYAAFLKALEDVKKVMNDPDATKEQVEAAQKALSAAIANLQENGTGGNGGGEVTKVDFTSLNKTIAEAKKYKAADYTAASFAALNKSLNNAEKIAKNPQATQAQVNAADTNLKAAIKGLVKLRVISTKKVTLGVKETCSVAAKGYTYTTSNKKIATVSKKGKVTAKKKGKVTVKATNAAGKVKVYRITVKKAPNKIVKVTPSRKTLKKGKTVKLKVKLPKGTAGKCTFKSNKPKVASVNSKGVVKAKKKGTAKITVRTYNKKKKVVTIKVK